MNNDEDKVDENLEKIDEESLSGQTAGRSTAEGRQRKLESPL